MTWRRRLLLALLGGLALGALGPMYPSRSAQADGGPASVIATIPVGDMPVALAVDPVTHRAYVANQRSGTVTVIDGEARKVLATLQTGPDPASVAVDPGLRKVYIGSASTGAIDVRSTATFRTLASIPPDVMPLAMTVDAERHLLYATGLNIAARDEGVGELALIDTRLDRVLATRLLPMLAFVHAITLDPLIDVVYIMGGYRSPSISGTPRSPRSGPRCCD